MKLIIDRIENDIVYLENEECDIMKIHKSGISGNIREGAVVVCKNDAYMVDEEATASRRASLRDRFKRLFRR